MLWKRGGQIGKFESHERTMGMEEKQPIAAFGCRWDDDTLRYSVEDTVAYRFKLFAVA